MDVEDQTDEEWPISHWVEYYNLSPAARKRVYNVISIEFTHTKMEHMVQTPDVARKLDWVQYWPAEFKDPTIQLRGKMSFPKVQHYCLMGVEGSYTDFHIDFGGTSVWYHVIKGCKTFCLVPPTEANLKRYEDWISSPNQDQTFFADLVPAAITVTVNAGNSLLIPTGWIHAVYTPIDSFVFGGNFLHSFNMKLQLDVVHLELRSKVRRKFRFPFFEETNWYAIENYVNKILAEAKRAGAKPAKEAGNSLKAKSASNTPTLPAGTPAINALNLASHPQFQAQLWNAFQRTGFPATHFPSWAEQVIAYGSPSSGSNTTHGASTSSNSSTPSPAPANAGNRSSPSPRSTNGPGSGSASSKANNSASSNTSYNTSSGGKASGDSGGVSPHSNASAAAAAAALAAQLNAPQKDRRAIFTKGDPIDDSWLSIWEREGLISILDWLPIAKELFPLSIYNQPGGPGKAQFYIDVLTCFLRRLPLPPLADYLKLHANDPSPYEPATVICKVCCSEEVPEGVSETWIGCDYCSHWWHAACLGLSSQQAEAMEAYFCSECRSTVAGLRRVSRDFYNWVITTPQHLLPAPKLAPSLPYGYNPMMQQMMPNHAMMGPNGAAMMQNPGMMLPGGSMPMQGNNSLQFAQNAGYQPHMNMQNHNSGGMQFQHSSGSLPTPAAQNAGHMGSNHHNMNANAPGNFQMHQGYPQHGSNANYPYAHPNGQNPPFPPLQLPNRQNMGHPPPHSPHSSQNSPHSTQQSPHMVHSPHMSQYMHQQQQQQHAGHMGSMASSQMGQMPAHMGPPHPPQGAHPQASYPSAYNQHPMMNPYPYGNGGSPTSTNVAPQSPYVTTTPPPTAQTPPASQTTPRMSHQYAGQQQQQQQQPMEGSSMDSIEAQHQALLQQQQQQIYQKQYFQMQKQPSPYQGSYQSMQRTSPLPPHAYPHDQSTSSSPRPSNSKDGIVGSQPTMAMNAPSLGDMPHPGQPQSHTPIMSEDKMFSMAGHAVTDHQGAGEPTMLGGNDEENFQEGSSTVKRPKLEETA